MSKVDLSVELCGIKLRNPVILTAGPLTQDGKAIQKAAKNGAGAAIIRSVSKVSGKDPKPCLVPLDGGILNATTFSQIDIENWLEREFAEAKKAGIPIIGSVFLPKGKPGVAEYLELAEKMAGAGIDMLHVVTNYVALGYEEARRIVKATKRATDLPICVNLNYSDFVDKIGIKMERAGADAALAVDGPWAMRIDAKTGRPVLGSLDGTGHICGRLMFPLTVYAVYKLAKAVKMPLIGCTGVSSGKDALELMMAGATAVGVQSAVILEGDEKTKKIVDEMADFLEKQGVKSVRDIIGKTVKLMRGRTEKDMEYYEEGNIGLAEMRRILRNP